MGKGRKHHPAEVTDNGDDYRKRTTFRDKVGAKKKVGGVRVLGDEGKGFDEKTELGED